MSGQYPAVPVNATPGTTYDLSEEQIQRLQNDFIYHAPTVDQIRRYELIRGEGRRYVETLMTFCPPSRELSIAITHIEEAIMFANSAIARHEKG